jgi:hypothetical protein
MLWQLVWRYGGINLWSSLLAFLSILLLVATLAETKLLLSSNRELPMADLAHIDLTTQRMIRRLGLLLPIPILFYCALFQFCALTYDGSLPSTKRLLAFRYLEQAIFGMSEVREDLPDLKSNNSKMHLENLSSCDAITWQIPLYPSVDNRFAPHLEKVLRQIAHQWHPPHLAYFEHTAITLDCDGNVLNPNPDPVIDNYMSDRERKELEQELLFHKSAVLAAKSLPGFRKSAEDAGVDTICIDFNYHPDWQGGENLTGDDLLGDHGFCSADTATGTVDRFDPR